MKLGKMGKILGLVLSMALLVAMVGISAPALANGGVILHPGYLTGSVAVTGQDITQVTVSAMDTEKEYSASVNVWVPGGASSIDYTLTVEGDRSYYVIATAEVVATDYTKVVLPVSGPVSVPIDGTVTHDMSLEPAFISGTISTTSDGGNIIQAFQMYAIIHVPEFDLDFHNMTMASGLDVSGESGREYTLLVEPGLEYYFYGIITINGIQYCPSETLTALGAGETLTRDFTIDVTAATISGTALLLGTTTDVFEARVQGQAYDPNRSAYTTISNISAGAYNLPVDAGTWDVQPVFVFDLTTGDLSGLDGHLEPPTTAVAVAAEEHVTQDLIINPGFITGTFSLSGANTDISSGRIRAYSNPRGWMTAAVHPDTGEYMFVASPGDDWQYHYIGLNFYYPPYTDPDLRSSLEEWGVSLGPYNVGPGETMSDVDLTYGAATVRLYYYVEGGGELSSPYYLAETAGNPRMRVNAYGSSYPTTEGQVIGTLFPGTYTIEAFAYVGGSMTQFGTFTVSVEEGDVVVIGGLGRPTIKVTSPTEGEVIPADTVTVEGTATDDVGIASITINGEAVTLTSTDNPDDPNEVRFSHEVSLPVIGENNITVVATDLDGTPPVTLELTVIREEVATPTTLTYTGDTLVAVSTPATLAAMLKDDKGQPISGATISFQVNDLDCSGVTGADGVASCEVTLSTADVYEVNAEFDGDALHQGSTVSAFLTVYDPEGGFVTGGGWIDSPEGAYTADPSLTGKANFGFVSKYKKGANVPTGQTEFQFKAGDLNFHSDSYQWLVVAGARAQYKGTGTINGAGNYGLMLTAIDAKLTPNTDVDMFRIKIWDKANDAIVYDNQMGAADGANALQAIGGGSIVIHTGKK